MMKSFSCSPLIFLVLRETVRTTPAESKPIRWTTLAPIGQRSFSRVSAARRLASITTLPVRTFCGMLKSVFYLFFESRVSPFQVRNGCLLHDTLRTGRTPLGVEEQPK